MIRGGVLTAQRFFSALRVASPDTIILQIVDYHAASCHPASPHAYAPASYHVEGEIGMFGRHDGRQRPARVVAGHLQYGEAHVAADAERDAEPDAAEQGQTEARRAARARIAAVRAAIVAQAIQRSPALTSTTSTTAATTRLVRHFIQLSVVVRHTRLRTRSTDAAVSTPTFLLTINNDDENLLKIFYST